MQFTRRIQRVRAAVPASPTRSTRPGRTVAALVLTAAVGAPLGACSLIEDAKDKADGDGGSSPSSSAPAAPAPDAAPDAPDAPAGVPPGAEPIPSNPARVPADPTRIGVCDVVAPADVQTRLNLPTVTARPDSVPFACRYDGPDGKQILHVTRTLLQPGPTAADQVLDREVARGARRVTDVGVPAAVRQERTNTTVVFLQPVGDQLVKVTIMPYGSLRETDEATLFALARDTVARF